MFLYKTYYVSIYLLHQPQKSKPNKRIVKSVSQSVSVEVLFFSKVDVMHHQIFNSQNDLNLFTVHVPDL